MKGKELEYRKSGPTRGTVRSTIAMRKRVIAEADSDEQLTFQHVGKYGISESIISNQNYRVDLPKGGAGQQDTDLDMRRIANEILAALLYKQNLSTRISVQVDA